MNKKKLAILMMLSLSGLIFGADVHKNSVAGVKATKNFFEDLNNRRLNFVPGVKATESFFEALNNGFFEIAASLVQKYPKIKDDNKTFLHFLLEHHYPVSNVKFLIDQGWDVNAGDVNKDRPLHVILKDVLQKQANNTLTEEAQFSAFIMMERFLNAGAQPLSANNKGVNLLHLAAQIRNPRFIERLLAIVDSVDDQDENGLTPLMYALSVRNNGNTMNAIYTSGLIDISLKDKKQKTLADYAQKYYPMAVPIFEKRQKDADLTKMQEDADLKKYLEDVSKKLQILEKSEANDVALSRNNKSWVRPKENPSKLIRQMPKQELIFELENVDWGLHKKSNSEILQLAQLEDKKRKL
jgi:ankyrin repeat protein